MLSPTLPPRFRILGVAGAGASATVFHVEDTDLGAERALKVARDPSPEARARFEREARTLARVRHAHLVVLYDRLELPEGPALVLEWCPGSLGARVHAEGPLSPRELARLGADAAGALAALHAAGAVHRDIAPANLLVATDGSVRVADLGVMTDRADVTVTPAGSILGSLTTMAPEQRGGSHLAVPASDVYALAVTLAWAGLGEYPGELYVDTVAARLRRALPGPLAEVLLAAAAWEAGMRPTATRFAEQLATVAARLPVAGPTGLQGVDDATTSSPQAWGGGGAAPPPPPPPQRLPRAQPLGPRWARRRPARDVDGVGNRGLDDPPRASTLGLRTSAVGPDL